MADVYIMQACDIRPDTVPVKLTLARIKTVVAVHTGVPVADMESKCRKDRIVRARHMAVALALELTDKSLCQTGNAFGGRDHSTIIYGRRRALQLCAEDPDFRRAMSLARDELSR